MTRTVAVAGTSPRGEARRHAADLPEGVELLEVAMAEDVVAVPREPFSGRDDQAS